jgi:hypothetical protein
MNNKGFAVAVMAAMLLLSGSLFAQAAAEAALAHALSSSAGSAMGKTMGHALGNAAGQVGGKLAQQTSTASPRQKVPAAKVIVLKNAPKNAPKSAVPNNAPDASVPDAASSSAPASLIASIQGGVTAPENCAPAATTANVEPSKEEAKASPATAAADCIAKPAPESENHPAVLNLPAPN